MAEVKLMAVAHAEVDQTQANASEGGTDPSAAGSPEDRAQNDAVMKEIEAALARGEKMADVLDVISFRAKNPEKKPGEDGQDSSSESDLARMHKAAQLVAVDAKIKELEEARAGGHTGETVTKALLAAYKEKADLTAGISPRTPYKGPPQRLDEKGDPRDELVAEGTTHKTNPGSGEPITAEEQGGDLTEDLKVRPAEPAYYKTHLGPLGRLIARSYHKVSPHVVSAVAFIKSRAKGETTRETNKQSVPPGIILDEESEQARRQFPNLSEEEVQEMLHGERSKGAPITAEGAGLLPQVDFLTPIQMILQKLKTDTFTNSAGQREQAVLGRNVNLTNEEITLIRQQIETARKALSESDPNIQIVYRFLDYYRNQLVKVRPELAKFVGEEIIVDDSLSRPFLSATPDGLRIAVPSSVHRLWRADYNLSGPIEKVLQQATQHNQAIQAQAEAQAAAQQTIAQVKKPTIGKRLRNLAESIVYRKSTTPKPSSTTQPEQGFPAAQVGQRIEEALRVIQEAVNRSRTPQAAASPDGAQTTQSAPATEANRQNVDMMTDINAKLVASTNTAETYSVSKEQLKGLFPGEVEINPLGQLIITRAEMGDIKSGRFRFSATYSNDPSGQGIRILGDPLIEGGYPFTQGGIANALGKGVNKEIRERIAKSGLDRKWGLTNIQIQGDKVNLTFGKRTR